MLLTPSPAVPCSSGEMAGQPDTEPRNQDQMDCEREPAEDEWKSWQRGQVRNTLHLVSAAAQWILLLACLIYLGIDSLQPSTVRTHVQPIVCWPVKLYGLYFYFFKKRKKPLGLSLFKPQVFNPFLNDCHSFFYIACPQNNIQYCPVQRSGKGSFQECSLHWPLGEGDLPPSPTCSDLCISS